MPHAPETARPAIADPASVDAAIESRFSARAFLPRPVPQAMLQDILRVASRAPSEPVYDLFILDNSGMERKPYPSDISREKFAEIEPLLRSVRRSTKPIKIDLYEVFCAVLYLLRTGCQWRYLPPQFPKWSTVYAYWSKWSEPDQRGVSVLQQALKKSGWRGPRETGAQRLQHVLDRGRAEREER